MNRTLVIGASGKIGKIIVSQLQDSGCHVVAMVRSKANAKEFIGKGIDVVEGNLEGEFEYALNGCDQVVFTAGSGAATGVDKTLLIDLWGACKVIDRAKENNIQRFVMVSSRGADNPDKGPDAIKPYLVAKHFADNYLVSSGLNYTILRPGRLTDEPGMGLIKTTRPDNPKEQVISREDTASAIYYCLTNHKAIGKIYELYKGSEPIDIALSGST